MKKTYPIIFQIITRLPLIVLLAALHRDLLAQSSDYLSLRLSRESENSRIKARNLTARIGDSSKIGFQPQFAISAWEGWAALTVSLEPKNQAVSYKSYPILVSGRPGLRIEQDRSMSHQFYPRADSGLEWEIILDRLPDTNTFLFSITTANLEFLFQPPLSEQEIADGVERPDSVVGSYAVYYTGGSGNHFNIRGDDTTFENYAAGKAFHIYRPRAHDSRGRTIWCDMKIDAALAITIPSDFLRTAEYPVTIDPTFGNSAVGASTAYITANACQALSESAAYRHTAAAGDIITSFSMYCLTYSNPSYVSFAAYSYVDGYPSARLAPPIQMTVTNGSMQWNTTAAVSQNMSAGTAYVIAYGEASPMSGIRGRFDAETNICSVHNSSILSSEWNHLSNVSNRWSMYATYSSGGVSPNYARRRSIVSLPYQGE